jgi:hypothetical protein
MIVLTRQEACTILLIDLSTGTEGFLTKTDGSHTTVTGFAATDRDGFPRGLFIYHELSSNDIIRNPSAQLSERAVSLRNLNSVTCEWDQTPLVQSASASRSRCRVAGGVVD